MCCIDRLNSLPKADIYHFQKYRSQGVVAPRGSVVLGVRFWVPSQKYFRTRYAVNEALMKAIEGIGGKLLSVDSVALTPEKLSADEDKNAFNPE